VASKKKGFEPVKSPDEMRATIQSLFEKAVEHLRSTEPKEELGDYAKPIDARFRTVINADNSIDAEISIHNIPKGMKTTPVSIQLANLLKPLGKNIWVTVGCTFSTPTSKGTESLSNRGPSLSAVKEGYHRYKGIQVVQTHWRRSSKEKQAAAFVAFSEIQEELVKKRYRKAEVIFVRYHWSPEGERPKRG